MQRVPVYLWKEPPPLPNERQPEKNDEPPDEDDRPEDPAAPAKGSSLQPPMFEAPSNPAVITIHAR